MRITDATRNPRKSTPGSAVLADVVLGVWLVISPFVLGYDLLAVLWNNAITGAAVLLLALLRLTVPHKRAPRSFGLVLGAWLIAAPFAFDYLLMSAFWNSVIVGALLVALAAKDRPPRKLPPA